MLFKFDSNDDRGFTLIESTIAISMTLCLGLVAAVAFNSAREPMAVSRAAVMQKLASTRNFAQNSAGEADGALLIFSPDGAGTSITVLRGRPIDGYSAPAAIPGVPPVHIDAALYAGDQRINSATIAVAPSGHIDLIAARVVPGSRPIANAPGCGTSKTALPIELRLNQRVSTILVDCATGEVNVDQPAAAAAGSQLADSDRGA